MAIMTSVQMCRTNVNTFLAIFFFFFWKEEDICHLVSACAENENKHTNDKGSFLIDSEEIITC